MFTWKNRKKIIGAFALFAACGLLAGCDDDHPHHPPPPPPHEDHRDGPHRDDHHDHRPPPRDDHHHQGHRPPPRDDHDQHGHRPPPQEGRRHQGHRRFASLTGAYSAFALNDAVMPKGTEISLHVVQGEDESLRLVDPIGRQYPIQFDADSGVGTIAGGSLSLRDDGNFVYRDARGGVWLVVRQ